MCVDSCQFDWKMLSVLVDRTEDPRSVEKRQELCLALRKRKDALEEEVRVKLKEIKMLCFQEGVSCIILVFLFFPYIIFIYIF